MNRPLAPDVTVSSRWSVEGMRCAACIARIERGLPEVRGIEAARVNLSARQVRVDHRPSLSENVIAEAFRKVGFDAHPFAGEDVDSVRSKETRALFRALAVAAFATMNIMLLSVSVWAGAEGMTRQLFHWISALIAIPTVAYSGQPFFNSALAALRNRRTNMDVPISIGVTLATAMSLYETAIGAEHAYFDGAVMLLFFLLIGRSLDSMMRARAENSVATLMKRIPRTARLATTDGAGREVQVEALMPGDTILVAAGERLPVDGRVHTGSSEVDRALVTGESLPEKAEPGGEVLAGTINLAAPLTVEVTRAAQDTVIAEISRLMERAHESRSAYVRIADRAARLYTPVVHSLALLAFTGWMIAGIGVHDAMLIAIATLIITCPCALGLAVPVAQVVAANALMKAGILVRDGSGIERLAGIDKAYFDKTGTVTLGNLVPLSLPKDSQRRAILATLARASRHPLSRALTCALEGVDGVEPESIREEAGIGVEAVIGGRAWRLGKPDWVGCDARDEASNAITAFGEIGGNASLIAFDDKVRPDARESFAALARADVPVTMLSGDRIEAVARVADSLSIQAEGGIGPSEKAARIEADEAAGRRVLMVGDGLNDGPALKSAFVSMAPVTASDVGQNAADFLFFGASLDKVPTALKAARRTMRIIRQNFALAIGYNMIAVPLALAGMVTPLIAAVAMSGSSLIVVANSLRLARAAK
ncbi:heavy metal translocating P-type ATPase [Sphingomicrobium sediminis]|uniref:Cadmium-translocating P-type ATPase n=1 Tax=Sphingomicrobium sediminis TaxID=2950949 RepID=A0A9X2EIP9_9SPHN|nr:heavy metal translocating P-type ATPase [Sphingomicrobium sediminis]MCM8558216.1 cadmium-translocating P-type ATPase [Sphingomicrobium sediminis]